MMGHQISKDMQMVYLKKIKDDIPAATSVHCLAQCMNQCLQEVARSSKPVKDDLNLSLEIIQLIKYSPKRQASYKAIQKYQDSSPTSGIRSLCSTRWKYRHMVLMIVQEELMV